MPISFPYPGASSPLNSVAAVSASDVWAVGSHYESGVGDQTLVEHWDGSAWSVVPGANSGTSDNYLYGVAATSANDVWAVGQGEEGVLVEHWDGSAWSIVPSANPLPTHFESVAVVSTSDAWAVGVGFYQPYSYQTLVSRYFPCPPTSTPTPTSTLTPTSTSTSCPIQFSDVPPDHTFYPFVRCLACLGIVNGYPDTTFRPESSVTRGQLAQITANAVGFSEPVSSRTFQDVPTDSTFYAFVERLAARQVVSGYTCGSAGEPCIEPSNLLYFRPGAGATRGQLAKFVSNAAGFNDAIPPDQHTFEDVAPSSPYRLYVERLLLWHPGIIQGYPCDQTASEPCLPPDNRSYFRPGNLVTRGQASKIVANTFFPGYGKAIEGVQK